MVKKILLGLAALLVLLFLVGFFLPSKVEFTRSTVINAPADYAFEEINNVQRWDHWSYWHSLDTTMVLSFSERTSGEGAWYTWTSQEMGKGKFIITESKPYTSIKGDLDFLEQGTAKNWYEFTEEDDSTKLTMGFAADMGNNPLMRWVTVTVFPSEMGKAFDHNLRRIKEIAEAKPRFKSKIIIENSELLSYVGISSKIAPPDDAVVGRETNRIFTTLYTDLIKAKVEITGAAFCIYTGVSDESIEIMCALPVRADAQVPAKYHVATLNGGQAAKAVHYGTYDNLRQTHEEIIKFISQKDMNTAGAPWEVYVTSPTEEKDTSKWVTEIYYPLQ